jgi:hypothetical protein
MGYLGAYSTLLCYRFSKKILTATLNVTVLAA